MGDRVPDSDDTAKAALWELVAKLREIAPAERESQLQLVERVLASFRLEHDVARGAPSETRKARGWADWFRSVAYGIESEHAGEREVMLTWLARVETLQPPRTSAEMQRSVAKLAKFYAKHGDFIVAGDPPIGSDAEEERTTRKLASLWSAELAAPVSVDAARAVLRAFRRGQGKPAHGEPSWWDAMHAILAPLGQSQSADTLQKNVRRKK